jgi:hypothetical protein
LLVQAQLAAPELALALTARQGLQQRRRPAQALVLWRVPVRQSVPAA